MSRVNPVMFDATDTFILGARINSHYQCRIIMQVEATW